MVVAEAPHRSPIQDLSQHGRAFLRFFGTVCSLATVERFGCVFEGGVIHHWVHLNSDDEVGQDAIYDAWRRFQTNEEATVAADELHIVFADEDDSAFPAEAEIIFVRE